MTRGITYLCWNGTNDFNPSLKRSIASLQHWHPELEHRVIFMPDNSTLLCKSQMYDLSPFDETLFLDADTTVMGKLDYGFIKAKQFGMACCINANPWNRRYFNIEQHHDEVEYSSGVVFFDKNNAAVKDVFARWNANNVLDSSSLFESAEGVRCATVNDQAPFSLAIHQAGFNPFVLPLNYNIYPKWQKTFWGEVLIWHGYDDIPSTLTEWNKSQREPGAVIRCVSIS